MIIFFNTARKLIIQESDVSIIQALDFPCIHEITPHNDISICFHQSLYRSPQTTAMNLTSTCLFVFSNNAFPSEHLRIGLFFLFGSCKSRISLLKIPSPKV